jgi:hypothetical protein
MLFCHTSIDNKRPFLCVTDDIGTYASVLFRHCLISFFQTIRIFAAWARAAFSDSQILDFPAKCRAKTI